MKELHDLKDRLIDELKDYGKMEITAANLEKIDTLAHAAKNVCKIIDSEDGGYSGRWDDRAYRDGSYRDGYARDGYARGRGYSRHSLSDKLRDLMEESPDDRTRTEIKRLIDKI